MENNNPPPDGHAPHSSSPPPPRPTYNPNAHHPSCSRVLVAEDSSADYQLDERSLVDYYPHVPPSINDQGKSGVVRMLHPYRYLPPFGGYYVVQNTDTVQVPDSLGSARCRHCHNRRTPDGPCQPSQCPNPCGFCGGTHDPSQVSLLPPLHLKFHLSDHICSLAQKPITPSGPGITKATNSRAASQRTLRYSPQTSSLLYCKQMATSMRTTSTTVGILLSSGTNFLDIRLTWIVTSPSRSVTSNGQISRKPPEPQVLHADPVHDHTQGRMLSTASPFPSPAHQGWFLHHFSHFYLRQYAVL